MPQRPEDNRDVARGAGLAFLGKLGAVIELLSLFAFAYFYGAPTYGVFVVLWSYVLVSTGLSDLAMTTALQRYIPASTDEDHSHRVLKAALVISITLSVLMAAILSLASPWLDEFINAAPEVSEDLDIIIAIYAWAIPLWCFIDVSTSAVRARRVFGPEVKVRIFYEQGLRLICGMLFFFMGFIYYGLFIAHLVALVAAGALSLQLLARHYDLKKMWRTPIDWPLLREMAKFGLPMCGNNFLKKSHSNFPVFVLNYMIPGAGGAIAAGTFTVARKVVSTLQVIRQSFEYVMAPMASAKNALTERTALQDMYAFSTRLICSLFLPVGITVIILREDIASFAGSSYPGAAILIGILAIGRAVEAFTGPSQALLEMMARSRTPLINGIVGFAITLILMLWLTPLWGPTGAAVATAIGINFPSIASLLQVRILYDLNPYDRRLIRPLVASIFGALLVAAVSFTMIDAETLPRILGVAGTLAIAYYLLLRFGYSDRDAATFGKLARWVRH